jgi:hypothetical protein
MTRFIAIVFSRMISFATQAQDSLNSPAFKVKIPTESELNSSLFSNWKYVHTVKSTKDGYVIKVNEYKKASPNITLNSTTEQSNLSPNTNQPPVNLPNPDALTESGNEDLTDFEVTVEKSLSKIDPKATLMFMQTETNKGNMILFEIKDQRTRSFVFNDIEFEVNWEKGVPNLALKNPYSTYDVRINFIDAKELVLFDKARKELIYFVKSPN